MQATPYGAPDGCRYAPEGIDMEYLSITEIWQYLTWLPRFVMKRLFSKQRLADLVIIDVRPRHESVKVYLSDVSSYNIYFQIINMTPFQVELDRAEIDFNCAGTSLVSQYIKKVTYGPGEISSLYIKGDIESAKADQIASMFDKNQSSINLHFEFNCRLHNFAKSQIHLDGVRPEFVNAESRRKKLDKA